MKALIDKFVALHRDLLKEMHGAGFLDMDRHSRLLSLTLACVQHMQVARASIWQMNDARDAIVCEILCHGDRFEQGMQLHERDFPAYFAALKQDRLINADDAEIDPRTREFTSSYLRPLGIRAMLDTPIFFAGKLSGVLCLEHTGNTRHWDLAELSFATAVADSITLGNEHDAWMSAAKEADYLAHFDGLTGLANRRMLEVRLQELLTAQPGSQQHALVVLGLNRFKHVNDAHGHQLGNELLRQVAHRLSHGVVSDGKAFRLGGDEFAFLVEGYSDLASLSRFLDEAMSMLNASVVCGHATVDVSASAGVALYPKDATTPDDLMRYAELAMYRAKERGRRQLEFFSSEWSLQLQQRSRLEKELRDAFSHDELTVFYQPIVNQQDRRVVALEALVRWQHPERGVLSPAAFLPLVSELDLMPELGVKVLDQACRDMKILQQAAPDLQYVSVNLSGEQLLDEQNIVGQVRMILQRHELPSHALELEIIEDLIGQDTNSVRQILDELVAIGVGLSIDDFGTGYSSLSRLKHLPVHKVKIDKSFVDGLPNDADDCSISQSIIGLANGLGMKIVAEGVENEAQARWLIDKGCHYLQGFHFCRPLQLEQLLQFLVQQSAHPTTK